jgi:hypothetical protein
MKHLFAAVLVVLVAAVIAPAALADAPSPKTITGTSVTNADGSRTLTVSGTYSWEKACDPKKPDGYAIAWNDPSAPGNVVANGVAVGTPSDNTIHLTNGCNSSTFGPLSHTYPASVANAVQVCVVTYHNKDSKKTAGGPTRQTDNSVEENKDHDPMVCFAFNPPPPNDACPNIEGIQSSVPAGMTKDSSGNCVTPPVTPGPPVTNTMTIEKVVVQKVVVKGCVCKPVAKKVAKKAKKKAKIKVKAAHKVLKPSVLPHTK